MRDERTHPHRPRLVVYHSTCRPLSSSPPSEQLCNRSCSNKHTRPVISCEGREVLQRTRVRQVFQRVRLMPMTVRCGAAAPCSGATTVRQLQHTRRVVERAQSACSCSCMRGHDENSAASACEGVDENARAWTKTRGNPDSCIGACQQRIDAVCRAGSASAVPSAQPPKSECEHASWLLASKTRSLQTFLAITMVSRAAPSKLLTVWIAQSSCRASAGCVD